MLPCSLKEALNQPFTLLKTATFTTLFALLSSGIFHAAEIIKISASSAQAGNPAAAALDDLPGTRWAAYRRNVPRPDHVRPLCRHCGPSSVPPPPWTYGAALPRALSCHCAAAVGAAACALLHTATPFRACRQPRATRSPPSGTAALSRRTCASRGTQGRNGPTTYHHGHGKSIVKKPVPFQVHATSGIYRAASVTVVCQSGESAARLGPGFPLATHWQRARLRRTTLWATPDS